ncbi:AAA family ATPase, partial (plasmid) [Mycolicibacterium fluoranthenivorans]
MRTLPKRFTEPDGNAAAQAATTAPVTANPALPVAAPMGQDWPGRDLLATPMLARVLLAAWGGNPAVVVPACPGAGKSRLVALLAGALDSRVGLRVAVAAQTREQAAELARRIAAVSERASLIVSGSGKKPVTVDGIRTVAGRSVRWQHSTGGEILIGTAARWLYVDANLAGADVLLVDEAWQCTYAALGALGALARQVVLVGDCSQLPPVITGSTERWEGQATGPHQPAPAALLAAHGEAITVHELTNSWRLGPQTCALVSQHFYPQMPFTS